MPSRFTASGSKPSLSETSAANCERAYAWQLFVYTIV